MKSLDEAPLGNKRVLVRINTDVPVRDGLITDDFRLRTLLPTLHYLLDHQAKVVLVGHLGRPNGQVEPALSLKPVFLHLSALLKKPISFAPTVFSSATEKAINDLQPGQILALENLRFDRGEESNSRTFAQKLASYADIYVNEAFAVSHREAASLVAITEFLPSYAGLLLEREVKMLGDLIHHTDHPFAVILGGAKISDKLPLINFLLGKADQVLLGGGIANTFAAVTGTDVKKSLVELDQLTEAKAMLSRGRGKIVLPSDFIWEDDQIVDIGPKSLQEYARILKNVKTIFWNGTLGITETKQGREGSEALAYLLSESKATTIIAGGNTLEVVNAMKLASRFSFVSTGGGAALELLSGKVLPGLKALN